MTVASRAVAMAVMTEARAVDVEQEGHACLTLNGDSGAVRHCSYVNKTKQQFDK